MGRQIINKINKVVGQWWRAFKREIKEVKEYQNVRWLQL